MKKSYKSLGLPHSTECGKTMKEVLTDPQAQPEAFRQSPAHQHESRSASAVRTAEHNGHTIQIKTTYEIKIDGKPFPGHIMVDDNGHLHCHSIPYETYGSAIDFCKSVIDIYPDSFPAGGATGGHH